MGDCFSLFTDPLYSDIPKTVVDVDVSKMKNANPLIIFFIGGPGSGKGYNILFIYSNTNLIQIKIFLCFNYFL